MVVSVPLVPVLPSQYYGLFSPVSSLLVFWKWKQRVSSKHWYPSVRLCNIRTQKNIILMFTTMRTSDQIIRIIRSGMMRWARHVAHVEVVINVCRSLVGKLKGRRPFWRSRLRWEDNFEMDLKEIECELDSFSHRIGSNNDLLLTC
jgi:hypothetical protein